MIWIAKRMQERPNRVQTAVEAAYDLARNQISGGNMDDRMTLKWFPFVGTLFFFIWFSNLIGYVPLPTNTEHETVDIFGSGHPAFALYAATANLSVPLVLTLMVWFALPRRGRQGSTGSSATSRAGCRPGCPGPAPSRSSSSR